MNVRLLSFIIAVALFAILFIIKSKCVDTPYYSEYDKFEERQKERNKIIARQDKVIDSLRKTLDTVKTERDGTLVALDSIMLRIKVLTNPVVSEIDEEEALLWLEQYNSTE